jgi:hypothetical protein
VPEKMDGLPDAVMTPQEEGSLPDEFAILSGLFNT